MQSDGTKKATVDVTGMIVIVGHLEAEAEVVVGGEEEVTMTIGTGAVISGESLTEEKGVTMMIMAVAPTAADITIDSTAVVVDTGMVPVDKPVDMPTLPRIQVVYILNQPLRRYEFL